MFQQLYLLWRWCPFVFDSDLPATIHVASQPHRYYFIVLYAQCSYWLTLFPSISKQISSCGILFQTSIVPTVIFLCTDYNIQRDFAFRVSTVPLFHFSFGKKIYACLSLHTVKNPIGFSKAYSQQEILTECINHCWRVPFVAHFHKEMCAHAHTYPFSEQQMQRIETWY